MDSTTDVHSFSLVVIRVLYKPKVGDGSNRMNVYKSIISLSLSLSLSGSHAAADVPRDGCIYLSVSNSLYLLSSTCIYMCSQQLSLSYQGCSATST